MGDFNIDLLHCSSHTPSQDFIDTMFSHSFAPLINKPTRVSNHSATLIDNIFHNKHISDESVQGILYTDISDHFPVFYIKKALFDSSKPS